MKCLDLLLCLCLLVLSASSTTYRSSEPCSYMFDGPSGEQISRYMKPVFEAAGLSHITVFSGAEGESCTYADGMRFSPIQDRNLEIRVDEVDLENKDLLDEYTFRMLTVLKEYAGFNGGQITLTFNASAPKIVVNAPYKTMMTILDQHPTGEGLLDALRAN